MLKSKRLLSFILIGSLVASSLVLAPKKAVAASVNLATFSFNKADGPSDAKDLNDTYGTKADSGYSPKSGLITSSRLYASIDSTKTDFRKLEWSNEDDYEYNNEKTGMPVLASSTKNPWGSTAYFLIKTSTKGYQDITLSFILGGSKKGPKDYKLQYSVDGKSFGNISDTSMSLHSNKKMYSYTYELPNLADKETLYIRIVTASTNTIEGGSFTSANTSGETAINNIVLKGNVLKEATPTPKPTAKPTAKPTNKPSDSASGTDNKTTNNNTGNTVTNNTQNAGSSVSTIKRLAKPTLTSYKAGTKNIKGKSVKKAKVTVKIGKKSYSTTANKKGVFKIKLNQKLKKGQTIKVSASKKNFKTSKTAKYKVK